MKIWFITRSYPPLKGGGPLMRELQVDFLRKKYDIEVITINHENNKIDQEKGITYIPYTTNKYIKKLNILLEMFGILKDSHNVWINRTVSYLKNKINDDDIIFSTTGGELASILIGDKLKQLNKNVKHIINYHDLLSNGFYNGLREGKRFHVKIDIDESTCILNADYILSNSNSMTNQLVDKFPNIKNKIDKLYFGYRDIIFNNTVNKQKHRDITIANIGSVGKLQRSEILVKAWEQLPINIKDKIKLVFIGNLRDNEFLMNNSEIKKIDYIPRDEMVEYVQSNIDVSFISLINNPLFKSAMPTKFYEYIGLELPIIGALPENCEAIEVIKKYGFGYHCTYDDIECLKEILTNLVNNNNIKQIKNNLVKYKHLFHSDNTLKIMYDVINNRI